jgi:uncharacterized MnhB-related membrane protein
MVLYLCVLVVFLLHRESLKLILVDEPLPEVVLSHSITLQLGLSYMAVWAPDWKHRFVVVG